MSQSTLNFVLIHGSWHTGECWRHVEKELQAAGHTAHAPTLPGRGDGVSTDVTMQDMADAVVDYVTGNALTGIVLVGHSAGGTIVCKAAEKLGDQIRRLVFVSPLLATSGKPIVDVVPPDYAGLFAQMAEASDDNTVAVPWPVWRDGFIGDADEATAKAAFDELCPEPFGPFTEAIDLSAFEQMPIAKSYVNCTEDNVFPVGEWGFFPRMYQQISPCRLVHTHGSHEMMYSNPEALAAALIKAGRD